MDRQEWVQASQCARDFCNCVEARAVEAGLYDGVITAVRHQGALSNVRMELFDTRIVQAKRPPLTTARRFAGFPELQQVFWDTMEEGLAYCTLCFGDLTMLFREGVLKNVWPTEKLRIEEEIDGLGRFFAPPSGGARNGHRSRKPRDGGNGRPR